MLINHIKISIRNLFRNRGFAFINILGLAIGMAASILISLWVFDELSYDKYHEKVDRIFRVERDISMNGERFKVPVTGAIYGETIKKDYPEFENMVRLYKKILSVEDQMNVEHREVVFFADNSFYDIFTYKIMKGDKKNPLSEPYTVVLTEKGAQKYFGDTDPINKNLTIEWGNEKHTYLVTAVMENIPHNTHFHFDVLASFPTLENYIGDMLPNWLSNYLYTYTLVKDGIPKQVAEAKLETMTRDYLIPAYSQFMKSDDLKSEIKVYLRPLANIHLNNKMWDIEKPGSKTSVYIFSVVAILVLIIACFNFMNLSTALAGKRSLEVGIKKTLGAGKKQLVFQFLGESMILSLIGFVLALAIIEFVLPSYNAFSNKELSLLTLGKGENLLILAIILFVTGILAGLYPAFYLSSFRPILVLKGKNKVSRIGLFNFRQVLVILQFAISIALIIGTLTAYLQLDFFRKKPLGFDKSDIIVLPVESNYVREHYDVFRSELMQQPIIKKVGTSGNIPTSDNFGDTGFDTELLPGETFLSKLYGVDYDYYDVYGIELVAGHVFQRDIRTDNRNWVINESAVAKMGYSDPAEVIGKSYTNYGNEVKGKIIGVVKDYHYQGLDKKIEPMSNYLNSSNMAYISVKYDGSVSDAQAVELIGKIWKKNFPEVNYSNVVLEQRYDNLYSNERKMQNTLGIFTILAIFVAALGLFGLAAYISQLKTKEIGIRKVHGASEFSIVGMLNNVFIKWVIIANVISWPVAYYFLDEWLATFYYRIKLPLWVFIISGLIGLIIAMVTVSYQAFVAARLNPVDSLRFE